MLKEQLQKIFQYLQIHHQDLQKMVLDKNTHGYYYVSSTKIDTITTHSIAIKI